MSNSFNDQLSRMKALMTYGSVNEDTKHISSYNIEYKAKAADGKYYGIIRENSKYFVKVATPGKELVAEAYQYIGGIQNKKNYEYGSYANALKQFELKLGSINEAYDEDRKVNVEALDPYKKEDLVIEGTEKMKNELARQRQIMRNASVIMNEATEIGSTPFKTQPEAEHDNSGDKDYPFTKEGKAEEDRGAIPFADGKPEKHSTTFGPDSNDVEKLGSSKDAKVADSVASEHPSGGKVARVNESMEECGGPMGCALPEEGADELDAPAEGENEPVDEPIDTDELDGINPEDVEGKELGGEEGLDLGDEEDLDLDVEDELGDEEGLDDDEFDFDDEDDDDLDLGDEEEFGDDEDLDLDDEEDFEGEDEFGDDEDLDLDDEEDFEGGEEDPEIELDENIVKHFRKLVRESIQEMMGEWDADDDLRAQEEGYDSIDDKMSHYSDEGDDFEFPEYPKEPVDYESLNEAKARKMNSIVESVVKDILNEDELHVFGDHPGYRKKPMNLPPTGSDKFQDNRDWNDDSVHSEEPFGKGKGDSTPFDILVAQITDSVMKQINEDKKKVK